MRAQPYRRRRRNDAVDDAVKNHGRSVGALLPVLQDVQSAHGCLDSESLGAVSDALHVPDSQTFGAASFYSMLSSQPRNRPVIRVCDGPVCQLHGCRKVRQQLEAAAADRPLTVERTSCLGLCDRAPAALVDLEACGPIATDNIATDNAVQVIHGWRGDPPDYAESRPGEVRVAMAHIGRIDPDDIESALALGAYQALQQALARRPAEVIDAVTASGLRGCGGAGFPTGRKWQLVADAPGEIKYVICNADESEPAAFKDRVLMEGDPHRVLEGMALAGYAVGARQGIIYIRGEYEQAARRLDRAIQQARERGRLGRRIGGGPFSFDVQLHRGAGAYICGEETALLESLEGRRPEPRIRPPYPTTCGLWSAPTVVNNVETLCKVPSAVLQATQEHSQPSHDMPDTKIFTVTGHVRRPGVFEIPLGISLRDVVDRFAGGMPSGSVFHAALTGGAAGTIVSAAALDVPLDFDSHTKGVSLGAGTVLVMNPSVHIIDLLSWLLEFFAIESCGKCTPCRQGTVAALRLVRSVQAGSGQPGDLAELKRLARVLRATSLCGLGQSVAWPIDSALDNFREELEALVPA